jgi:hypothetical protein
LFVLDLGVDGCCFAYSAFLHALALSGVGSRINPLPPKAPPLSQNERQQQKTTKNNNNDKKVCN